MLLQQQIFSASPETNQTNSFDLRHKNEKKDGNIQTNNHIRSIGFENMKRVSNSKSKQNSVFVRVKGIEK